MARGLDTKDETVEADIMDSSSHERVDYENRFKDDPLPSTSKQSTEPNHWKNEVGKRHQTYSGPLPGTVHNNSSSDKSWSAERFYSFQLRVISDVIDG